MSARYYTLLEFRPVHTLHGQPPHSSIEVVRFHVVFET